MRAYKPKGDWAARGLSWPGCPAREIDQMEFEQVVRAHGKAFARKLYEEVNDGSVPTAPGATRQADDVPNGGGGDIAAARGD